MMKPWVKPSLRPSADLYGPCSTDWRPGILFSRSLRATNDSSICSWVISGLNWNTPKCLVIMFCWLLLFLDKDVCAFFVRDGDVYFAVTIEICCCDLAAYA